jgi:hypothetical protein
LGSWGIPERVRYYDAILLSLLPAIVKALQRGAEGRGFKPRRSPQFSFAAYRPVTGRYFLRARRFRKARPFHFPRHGGKRSFIPLLLRRFLGFQRFMLTPRKN